MCADYDRKDHYYQRAKDEGYRSRAAFKLIELNKKYKFITQGSQVLDLGCWPGGWVQVAAPLVGEQGVVVGIDLKATDPFPQKQVVLMQGDVRDLEIQTSALAHAKGGFSTVLSDMSPHLTGIKDVDSAATVACAELAAEVALKCLKPGGAFICKVFKNGEIEKAIKALKPAFTRISREELDSTRSTSREFYIVAQGFRSASPKAVPR